MKAKKLLLSGLIAIFTGLQTADAIVVGPTYYEMYGRQHCENNSCRLDGELKFRNEAGVVDTMVASMVYYEGGDSALIEGSSQKGKATIRVNKLCGGKYKVITQANYTNFHGNAEFTKTYIWECNDTQNKKTGLFGIRDPFDYGDISFKKIEFSFKSPSGDSVFLEVVLSGKSKEGIHITRYDNNGFRILRGFDVVSGNLSVISAGQKSIMLSSLKKEGVEAMANLDLYIWKSAIDEVFTEEDIPEIEEAVYEAWKRIQANPMKYFKKAFQGDNAFYHKGLDYMNQGNREKAIEYLKKSCELGFYLACSYAGEMYANSPVCDGSSASTCWQGGNNKKAYEYMLNSAKYKEQSCKLQCAKSEKACSFALSDCEKALDVYYQTDIKKYISLAESIINKVKKPDDNILIWSYTRILADLGNAYEKIGNKDKAIKYGEEACEAKSEMCGRAGDIYLDYGEYQKAYEKYIRACNSGVDTFCKKADYIKGKYGL